MDLDFHNFSVPPARLTHTLLLLLSIVVVCLPDFRPVPSESKKICLSVKGNLDAWMVGVVNLGHTPVQVGGALPLSAGGRFFLVWVGLLSW